MRAVNAPGTYQQESQSFTTTATEYTDGDVIGGLLSFSFDLSANGGIIEEFVAYDTENKLLGNFEVFFFNAAPTTVADNAAFALSDTDLVKLVGHIPQTDFVNVAAATKGFDHAAANIPFTGDRLWAFVRLVEDAEPLAFTVSKTVTFRVVVSN